MCRLELYLKGIYIKSEEVFLSDNRDDLTMEANCKIRELQLNAAIETMKIGFAMAIVKSEYDYVIVPVIKSIKFDYYDADGYIS